MVIYYVDAGIGADVGGHATNRYLGTGSSVEACTLDLLSVSGIDSVVRSDDCGLSVWCGREYRRYLWLGNPVLWMHRRAQLVQIPPFIIASGIPLVKHPCAS